MAGQRAGPLFGAVAAEGPTAVWTCRADHEIRSATLVERRSAGLRAAPISFNASYSRYALAANLENLDADLAVQ
jgi:hypothetical protein